MWSFDRPVLATPDSKFRPGRNSPTRKVRLNLPSTHVPLFHAWRP